MGRKTINFLEDEEISNCVKKYPCLYDKGDQYYKDKPAKTNAADGIPQASNIYRQLLEE